MKTIALKLVLRSWWRNKTFSVISIVSLAIGIACTNLLAAFVIYEYNIEGENPNKSNIIYMAQDSPMQSGEVISYIVGNVPELLKKQYSEVVDYLRFNSIPCSSVKVENSQHAPISILTADTTFGRFFPYKTIYGNLRDALSGPDKAALSESCARKLFGNGNPIGKTFTVDCSDIGVIKEGKKAQEAFVYQVAAVLKEYDQSYLKFDMLTANPADFYGGPTLLLVNETFDSQSFPQKLKQDKVPTLQMDLGSYHFYTLQESYFQKYPQESIPFINRGQHTLLSIGMISALLILLIACFNYVNLNFSRVLQQVRMIHTQKLMGASLADIIRQLFTDTLLTVGVACCLSLLIAHDLMPVFNNIMSGRLTSGFFLNKQVLPVIGGLIILLSALPALYMSRKISSMTDSNYRLFFTGNKKRRIVTFLSVAQFAISIGLVMGTLTVYSQLKLLRENGKRFENLIEIGSWTEDCRYMYSLFNELQKSPFIKEMTLSRGSILSAGLRQIIVKNPDGSESFYSCTEYAGEENLLSALQLQVQQGIKPHEAISRYEQPVYINRRYADILIPHGENPVGQPLSKYDDFFRTGDTGSKNIICGITDNMYINSIEEYVHPTILYIDNTKREKSQFIYLRIDEKQKENTFAAIRTAYKKVKPGRDLTYTDVHAEFMQRNRKTTDMAGLLLMYAAISLFLTCFGLFGMALYATEQRTKEIGIRKVNGAGTWGILFLLTRQFLIWIAIAFVIAVPCTWYALDWWLDGFVQRITVSPIHILLAAAIVTIVTLLTVGWHSYKAASGNPVKSLKAE